MTISLTLRFNFEKLETWHEAIAFADIVYQLTCNFPAEERFGLTNQMRRAAVSISSNLAEGCSRSSKIDYTRFVEIATGSVFEVVSQATIGRNQGFLNQGEYEQVYDAAEKQSRMLSGATCCIATCLADTAHPWAKLGENRTGVWTAAS
jgi:four helix bundle protein